jgi:hypothetical protein
MIKEWQWRRAAREAINARNGFCEYRGEDPFLGDGLAFRSDGITG